MSLKKVNENLIKNMSCFYQENTVVETAKKFNVCPATVKKYCKKRIILSEEERDTKRKINGVKAVQRRRKKIKEMAVEYKGGKCIYCKYNKYIGALEFHHLDPNEKDFSLSDKGYCRSWEIVKKELDKCVLVCSNCHKEIHAGIIKF